MVNTPALQTLRQEYHDRVEAGYRSMGNQRAVICATVRDCADALTNNIPVVERLRNCFLHCDVIVVENDSKDGTKEVLAQWQHDSDCITLLGEDTGTVTIPDQKTGAENPWFSRSRIGKMAGFRNQYLDHIDTLTVAPDVMLVMDLDCSKFFPDGIAHSFGQEQQWDMIAANGRHFRERDSIYFDTYAVRERGAIKPQTVEEIYANQEHLAFLGQFMPLFAVDSAFGGLGLYRYAAVQGLRYSCVPNDNPEVTVLCEHPAIHLAMQQQGHDKVFINPNMIVHYNEPKRHRKFLRSRMARKT